jgi:hypothetical protein
VLMFSKNRNIPTYCFPALPRDNGAEEMPDYLPFATSIRALSPCFS